MGESAVRLLGLLSLGFGLAVYAVAYLTLRPILIDAGVLQYVPRLGGLTAVIGLLVVLALTWTAFVRAFRALDVHKM